MKTNSLTKQDVLNMIQMYKMGHIEDAKVLDGLLEYLQNKFSWHTYEMRFEANHGRRDD